MNFWNKSQQTSINVLPGKASVVPHAKIGGKFVTSTGTPQGHIPGVWFWPSYWNCWETVLWLISLRHSLSHQITKKDESLKFKTKRPMMFQSMYIFCGSIFRKMISIKAPLRYHISAYIFIMTKQYHYLFSFHLIMFFCVKLSRKYSLCHDEE